jgi:hypothetical protein
VKKRALHNNGLQLTKATRCAPLAVRSCGQSLKVAFAAEPECSTGAPRPVMPRSQKD